MTTATWSSESESCFGERRMCFSAFSVFESITLLKCSVVRPRRARLICAVDGYCGVWRGGAQKLRLMIVVPFVAVAIKNSLFIGVVTENS
jgi:hypothetical protein